MCQLRPPVLCVPSAVPWDEDEGQWGGAQLTLCCRSRGLELFPALIHTWLWVWVYSVPCQKVLSLCFLLLVVGEIGNNLSSFFFLALVWFCTALMLSHSCSVQLKEGISCVVLKMLEPISSLCVQCFSWLWLFLIFAVKLSYTSIPINIEVFQAYNALSYLFLCIF